MTEGEAKGLIHQADKVRHQTKAIILTIDQTQDGNESIDFSEFSKLWAAIKGEGEVGPEEYFSCFL